MINGQKHTHTHTHMRHSTHRRSNNPSNSPQLVPLQAKQGKASTDISKGGHACFCNWGCALPANSRCHQCRRAVTRATQAIFCWLPLWIGCRTSTDCSQEEPAKPSHYKAAVTRCSTLTHHASPSDPQFSSVWVAVGHRCQGHRLTQQNV